MTARTGSGAESSSVGRLFDRYIVVDWSAANTPKLGRDSIWLCSRGADTGGADGGVAPHDAVENLATRAEARERVRRLLLEAVARSERVLVGFDFPYGYAKGFAALLGLGEPAWEAIWRHLAAVVEDDESNRSNRFEVAAAINRQLDSHVFWGVPAKRSSSDLSSKKDRVAYSTVSGSGLSEWRVAERSLVDRGLRPQPAWKLLGAGSVGSQTLLGIPVLASLRWDPELAGLSAVWPFEVVVPSLTPGKAAIVHAEVWPSLVDYAGLQVASSDVVAVKDRLQVEALAAHLAASDEAGELTRLLAAGAAPSAAEEGWILGVTEPDRPEPDRPARSQSRL